jgi:hypothetical protein
MVNFTLSGLNQTFTLGVSGELAAEAPTVLDVSATAVYNVKLSDMLNVFKFQADSFDVNDISDSDIKYYVFDASNAWPTNLVLNPANADMSYNPMFATGGDIAANKNKIKHDFVRYLSFKLFNTSYGVDLFSNEDDLLNDLVSKGATAHTNLKAALAAVSTTSADLSNNSDVSGNYYATNSLTGNTNFSRELMRQVANAAPGRFGSMVDISGLQSVPLVVDDTINFKLSISAATGQHDLTGRTGPFDIRVYKIRLVLKADGDATNVTPIESGNTTAYPYHP